MTKREKTIIGLMSVVVIIGAYSIFSSSPEDTAVDPEKTIRELNSVIADLAVKINRDVKSNAAYILNKAGEKWKKDPFLQSSGYVDAADKEETYQSELPRPASILFTGFIQVGNKMLAIINGFEYEEGDILGSGDYSIKKISSEQVVLESESGEDLVVLIEKY